MPTAFSYLGITASTGGLTNDNFLSNWVVKKVMPTSSDFKVLMDPQSPSPIRAGDNILLNIYMFDRCNIRYVPFFDSGFDSENFVNMLDFSNTCKLMYVNKGEHYKFFESGPAFQAAVSCLSIGSKKIQMTYKGESIGQAIDVSILAGGLWAASVSFPNGTRGSVDQTFHFWVKPLDRGNNLAKTTLSEVSKRISFRYPNPAFSKMSVTNYENSDGSYGWAVQCEFSGNYALTSPLFIFAGGLEYNFYISSGAPDMTKSIGKVVDKNLNKMDFVTFVPASNDLYYLAVNFTDKNGNTANINNDDYHAFLKVFNVSGEITSRAAYEIQNSYKNLYGYQPLIMSFRFTQKGSNQLLPQYLKQNLNCPYCQFQVTAGDVDFSQADLYVPDDSSSIKYSPNKNGNLYTITKPQAMSYLLVLKDQFGNSLDSVDPSKYQAVLYGNNMVNITLSLASYSIGAQVTVPSSSLNYFQILVGRTGYGIKIIEISTKKEKTFDLTIVSDGSDSDADNGDYNYLFTTYYWVAAPEKNVYATVGVKYTLAIQLNTFTGKRYNDWIDEKLVNFTIITFSPEKGETIYPAQKGPKRGVYTVDFFLTVGDGQIRKSKIIIDGKPAIKYPLFKSMPGNPSILTIDENNLNGTYIMKNATVQSTYQFLCHLTDNYKNPVNAKAVTDLNLLVKNSQWSFLPTCTVQTLGDYTCKFSPQAYGEYNLTSAFFQNPYLLYVVHGDPSSLTSNAGIQNDVSGKLAAGVTIKFRISPKDGSGASLTKSETTEDLGKFSLSLKNPDNVVSSVILGSTNVNEDGEIITETFVTKTGQYSFLPLLNGESIMCEICAFEIIYNDVDATKVKVFQLVNENRQQMLPEQTLQIDNLKIVPVFYMQFYDKYYNKRPVSSDLNNFNCTLSVPRSQFNRYNFTASETFGDYQFILPTSESDEFQFELANSDCSLSFTADNKTKPDGNNAVSLQIPKVILMGSSNDSSYDNDYPDPNNVKVIPNSLIMTAGEYASVQVELRAASGKLYRDQVNKGWYSDDNLAKAFTLVIGSNNSITSLAIVKGKQYGTYTISFTTTIANYSPENLTISYLDPSKSDGTYVTATQRVPTAVNPAGFVYMVSQDSSEAVTTNCKATTKKVLTFNAFDTFNNKIKAVSTEGLGFKLSNTNPLDLISPSINADTEGLITLSMLCKYAGKVTLTSILFKKTIGGSTVENYQFSITPGNPSPLNSLAYLSKSEIDAGQNVIWTISPSDIYSNPINLNSGDSAYDLALFNSTDSLNGNSKFLTENGLISEDGMSLYWTVNLTTAGVHSFKAFYQNLEISSNSNKVKVNALSAFFTNSVLAKFDIKSSTFEEYDGELFVQDIKEYPQFKVNFYDKFKNPVSPPSWNLNLFLWGNNVTEKERIDFCLDSNNYFSICEKNSENQGDLDKNPKKRYSVLVANLDYILTLINDDDASKFQTYSINITGINNNDTSNLPVDPKNTIITPKTPLQTVAGESTRFTIELRTTLANYRRNEWYENPMSSIRLNFKYNQSTINYTIEIGDITDRYFVTIQANETHPIEDPNIITVVIEDTPFTGYQPKWIVTPAPISAIYPALLQDSSITVQQDIPQGKTVDDLYVVYFQANDRFDNKVNLVDGLVNVILNNSNGQNIPPFTKEFLNNGLLKVSFQPKKPDTFKISFGKDIPNSYQTEVKQGEINEEVSYGNLQVNGKDINSSLKAGTTVQVMVYPKDKWGNALKLTQELVTKTYFIKYYYNKPGVQGYIVGEAPAIINSGNEDLRFEANVTLKGNYIFKVTINEQPVRMILGMVTVIPADAVLSSSVLKYLDDEANAYVLMDKVIPVKEDNKKDYPSYLLTLADIYGNLHDQFDADPSLFSVILTGNQLSSKPLNYVSNQIVGNSLYIALNNDSLQGYRDALFNSTPYSFIITWDRDSGKEQLTYPIILLGEGTNDTDAEINTDEDLSKTWLSKNSLNLIAGNVDSFLMEIRTTSGKRKADFRKNVTFAFLYQNGTVLQAGNFNASLQQASLRGRFLITVYGELANNRDLPFKLKMSVVNNEIPQTVNISVTPNSLDHIKLASDLNIAATADFDYVFDIIPYDIFNNVADVTESDVNLKIQFPTSDSNVTIPSGYSTKKDPSSGWIRYVVKSRIAGYYQLNSSLLTEDKTPKFLVTPGVVNGQTSKADVEPNSGSIKAGERLIVNIVARDSYYNKIYAGKNNKTDQSLLSNFTLSLAQGEYKTNLQLIVDTPNSNLQANFLYTQAGNIVLSPELDGSTIQCDGCNVKISPGDLDIQNTKFYALNFGDTYNETRVIKVVYGSKNVIFTAQLYDTYMNLLQQIEPEAGFTLKMDGNNMNALKFNYTSDGVNSLGFSVLSSDAETFSRLVPRNNYSLCLTYELRSTSSVCLTLEIIGNDDGSGNGDYQYISVQPQIIRIAAGHKGYLTVTLLQKWNLRYNGVFDIKNFIVNEKEGANLERLNYLFYNGDKNGVFFLEVTGTQAFNGTDKKTIQIAIETIENKFLSPIIEIIIIPDYPLANNSIIISPSNQNGVTDIEANEKVSIIFQLFDKFNNLFSRSDLAGQLYAKITNDGKADFNATILNTTADNGVKNNSYVITMYPKYPPRILQVQVFYQADEYTSYPISSWPFTYSVHTIMAPEKTDIVGNNLTGVNIGQNFTFSILVKDTEGYCFEEPQTVSYRILGPYLTDDVNDKNLTSKTATLFNKSYEAIPVVVGSDEVSSLNSSDYVCKRYYKASVLANVIQKTGYYQIEATINGINSNDPVKIIRRTYMTPGSISPANSLLTVPSLYNRGSNPLNLLVNTPMRAFLVLRDSWKNVINSYVQIDKQDYFNFTIQGLEPSDYEKNITLLDNATFQINLVVKKTGVLGLIAGSLMNVTVTSQTLDKTDFPSVINILAGPCSVKYPEVEYVNQAVAGEKQFLQIQCRDEFNNTVYNGGASFELKITGVVDVVGIDVVNANVKDANNGQYNIDFTFTWAGNYTVLIFLNNEQYTDAFYIKVVNSMCSLDKPYYCLGGTKLKGQCAASYRDCGYDFIDPCPTDSKPIHCNVNGVAQCVSATHFCDCEGDLMKCSGDDKCVDIFLSSELCAVQPDSVNCPSDFPVQCPDMSCRVTSDECPSYPGCPPGTKMCADQTCVDSTKDCPVFESCQFGFKCEDQSCVNDLNDCPTRMTCTNKDWIICPDKTCASSELLCKLPNTCSTDADGKQLFLCPDQTCRSSQNDCPKKITCPLYFALCEDGSCRKECTVSMKETSRRILNVVSQSSKLFRLLANTSDVAENSTSNCPLITCPGGECTDNYYKCPSVEACPQGYTKCSDLSCAESQEKCLVQVCPQGKYHCWDGNCVDNKENCATRTVCPPLYPVKCPDGSCTNSLEKCDDIIECPAFRPYRCANGECRGKSSECPTLITCPTNRPFLCPDNTCKTSKERCTDAVINMVCPEDKVRCADGSCAFSKMLCPTIQSCNPGQVRCWDNSCANGLSDCPDLEIYSEICPESASLRCPDGSCRANLTDCPTQLICPIDRPVKCDDGTCRQSNSHCALNTQCPDGYKRCPDGSCKDMQNKCGTSITCSEQAPFLCYDNTCKIDPRDCPPMPSCSDLAPILCPDGTCASQRMDCKGFDACDEDESVRCPDFFCYSSRKNCSAFTGCPNGKILCDDGSCATSSLNCPSLKCPIQLPHQCPNGFCVSDSKYCDNPENGCPYNKPFKCADGTCSSDEFNCPYNNSANCTNGDTLCPDGSCAKSIERCPNAMGCSIETPFMCGNGQCININKTKCPVFNCPKDSPIKCLNGMCAKSITYCSSFIPLEDYAQCANEPNGNNVPCADGRCVASADLCRPLLPCDSNSVRCKDNTCRPIKDLCPLSNTSCPLNKPYRCESGVCAQDSLSCPTINGCPAGYPWKCEQSGTCVKENSDCQATYQKTVLLNKCKIDAPYLCPDGSCVINGLLCPRNNSCPDSNSPYKCLDGSCVSNKTLCPKPSECKQYLCPDFRCVSDSSQCLIKSGCPASKPFKCADGKCVSTPFSLYTNLTLKCTPTVACPKYKPYLCGDGECQGHPSLCRTQQNCPNDKPFRCPDQHCAVSEEECLTSKAICPQNSPFMCEDGSCVSVAIQCQTSNNFFCSDETPFPCASGKCVKYPIQCVSEDIRSGKIVSSRLLANGSTVVNTSIDPGCTGEAPHRCYDGSCRSNVMDCPFSNGCLDMGKPYKCPTGVCVATAKECQTETLAPCENNLTRCEDGYCRYKCPYYNGCPSELPLLCPNGFCARSLSECAGDSACPLLTKPYRCVDNTCVQDRSACTTPKRNYQSEIVQITISPTATTTISFIPAGENSQVRYGQLIVPAGAILPAVNHEELKNSSNSTTKYYSFVISPVPQSLVKDAVNPIDDTKKDFSNEMFPYTDGKLEFHQSVRSPIVKLQTMDRSSGPYRFPIVLYLSSDILDNSDPKTDYCMGKLNENTGKWECSSRELVQQDSTTDKLGFQVGEDGVYSVIFNPKPSEAVVSGEPCGFFCEYKMTLLYVLIGLVIFSVIFSYCIWRISRYVTKYRQAKKQMDNYREQISELEQAQTDVQGQTIKDKIEGISFTTNPAFKEQSSGILYFFYLRN